MERLAYAFAVGFMRACGWRLASHLGPVAWFVVAGVAVVVLLLGAHR
jgi:hypothetical protein